jgi:hypothetical protein
MGKTVWLCGLAALLLAPPVGADATFGTVSFRLLVTSDKPTAAYTVVAEGREVPVPGTLWACRQDALERTAEGDIVAGVRCEDGRSIVGGTAACSSKHASTDFHKLVVATRGVAFGIIISCLSTDPPRPATTF